MIDYENWSDSPHKYYITYPEQVRLYIRNRGIKYQVQLGLIRHFWHIFMFVHSTCYVYHLFTEYFSKFLTTNLTFWKNTYINYWYIQMLETGKIRRNLKNWITCKTYSEKLNKWLNRIWKTCKHGFWKPE